MKPEYFPPREDVILQNEAPTDFYILVSGAVVSTYRTLLVLLLMINPESGTSCLFILTLLCISL